MTYEQLQKKDREMRARLAYDKQQLEELKNTDELRALRGLRELGALEKEYEDMYCLLAMTVPGEAV